MYLAGVSVRRVEDITEALWGTRVSPSTVRPEPEDLRPDRCLAEPADRGRASVCVSGWDLAETDLGRRGQERGGAGGQCGRFRGLPGDPGRGARAPRKTAESWPSFLRHLKDRGIRGCVCSSRTSAWDAGERWRVHPEAPWQRCMVHWYRNVMSVVPGKVREVMAMLKAIHAQESRDAG